MASRQPKSEFRAKVDAYPRGCHWLCFVKTKDINPRKLGKIAKSMSSMDSVKRVCLGDPYISKFNEETMILKVETKSEIGGHEMFVLGKFTKGLGWKPNSREDDAYDMGTIYTDGNEMKINSFFDSDDSDSEDKVSQKPLTMFEAHKMVADAYGYEVPDMIGVLKRGKLPEFNSDLPKRKRVKKEVNIDDMFSKAVPSSPEGLW